MEPYDPVMSFEDFITDDEDIVDEVQSIPFFALNMLFAVIFYY